MWTVTGHPPRRVLIYSGNMFNELPEVPYPRLDHVPKSVLGETVAEVTGELMGQINTRLFMVITTP